MIRKLLPLACLLGSIPNGGALAARPTAPPAATPAAPAPTPAPATAPAPMPAAPPAGAVVAPSGPPSQLALRQGLAEGPALTLFLDLRDDRGRAVGAIDPAQLQLEIGPYPARIESVAPFAAATGADAGVAAIFLVDVSKSLPEAGFARVREALNQWAVSLGEHDRMAIVTFGEQVTTLLDFTRQAEMIQGAVAGLRPSDRQTRLHDALLRGLDLGQRRDADLPRRRVIVLLSDGLDDASDGAPFQEVFSRMEEAPVPVYAIAFDPGGAPARREQGRRTLGGLARASGGELLEVVQNRFAETYASARQGIAEALTVRARCETCPPDGRVYPVQLRLNAGSRVVTGSGHVRLMPGDATTPPAPVAAADPPWLAWLPAPLRPWWGALLGGLLALIGGGVLLVRARRPPPAPPEPVAPPEVAAPLVETVGPPVITPDPPAPPRRPERQEDPGLRVRLTLIEGNRPGHSWGFMLQTQTALGRGPANDIVLADDPQISGRHCVLLREGERIFVQDHQSTNGTFVNGVEIKARYRLEEGDVLGLGNTTLRITWSGA